MLAHPADGVAQTAEILRVNLPPQVLHRQLAHGRLLRAARMSWRFDHVVVPRQESWRRSSPRRASGTEMHSEVVLSSSAWRRGYWRREGVGDSKLMDGRTALIYPAGRIQATSAGLGLYQATLQDPWRLARIETRM